MTFISLADVQAVYSGPERVLWELIMGQQIHIGGLQSSQDLAAKASIAAPMCGIDLCCCSGAGMRFLTRMCGVARMRGVDATPAMVELGQRRNDEEGLAERIEFLCADVCDSRLASNSADFIWGEDAWCYVLDKPRLIAEAARLVKTGGVIAFTDWVEGPVAMSPDERLRLLTFMKFPNVQSIDGYAALLAGHNCVVQSAENTGRFAPYIDLYLNMLTMQLTYDALKIIGFDMAMMGMLGGEMAFMQTLAHEGKIAQGLFVARKQ